MGRRLVSVVLLAGVAACGDPTIVVPEVLSVVTVLPSHGATGVGIDVQPLIYFSSPLKDTTAAARALSLDCLGTPPCASAAGQGCLADPVVASTVTFEVNQVAHIVPDPALQGNVCYAINIAAGIDAADSDIGPLPLDIRSAFETTP
jgi:hypothetical protein